MTRDQWRVVFVVKRVSCGISRGIQLKLVEGTVEVEGVEVEVEEVGI